MSKIDTLQRYRADVSEDSDGYRSVEMEPWQLGEWVAFKDVESTFGKPCTEPKVMASGEKPEIHQ